MKFHPKFPTAAAVLCLCCLLVAVPAYGYADPNTVGLLSQVLTPLLIMVGAGITFLRRSIVNVCGGVWRRLRGRSDA